VTHASDDLDLLLLIWQLVLLIVLLALLVVVVRLLDLIIMEHLLDELVRAAPGLLGCQVLVVLPRRRFRTRC